MYTKTYNKQSDAARLSSEIVASGKSQYPATGFRFYGVNSYVLDGLYKTDVNFADDITAPEITSVDAIVDATIPLPLPEPIQPSDIDNKPYVRAEVRPLTYTTIFTGAGDLLPSGGSPAVIGGGTKIVWDSRNVGEFTTVGAPMGFMQKKIDLYFCDEVCLRAGYIFTDCEYDDTLDLYVMAPPGYPYSDGVSMKYNTTGDFLAIEHNIVSFPFNTKTGAIMLDSGTSSPAIPVGYPIRIVITVPVTDTTCVGSGLLMMYRKRTVIL